MAHGNVTQQLARILFSTITEKPLAMNTATVKTPGNEHPVRMTRRVRPEMFT